MVGFPAAAMISTSLVALCSRTKVKLTRNTDIVRHGTKIASVRANALYILTSVPGLALSVPLWPTGRLRRWRASKGSGRLGGQTVATSRLTMTPILSPDVVTALIGAGAVGKEPTSKRDLLLCKPSTPGRSRAVDCRNFTPARPFCRSGPGTAD